MQYIILRCSENKQYIGKLLGKNCLYMYLKHSIILVLNYKIISKFIYFTTYDITYHNKSIYIYSDKL